MKQFVNDYVTGVLILGAILILLVVILGPLFLATRLDNNYYLLFYIPHWLPLPYFIGKDL